MACASRKSLFTFTGGHVCDGWKGISLEECKAKCTNNEVPNDKCPRQNVNCEFVHYYHTTKWCHLGDSTCKPTRTNKLNTLMRKGYDNILFFKWMLKLYFNSLQWRYVYFLLSPLKCNLLKSEIVYTKIISTE